MDLELKGKTVFITGSTAGIGFATAKALLSEGASVVLNGRSPASVTTAVKKLEQEFPNESVSGIAADFSLPKEVNSLLENLPSRHPNQ